jgi:Immunoglobulin-like domain of bacterial spore germination/Sporulation and spore germination
MLRLEDPVYRSLVGRARIPLLLMCAFSLVLAGLACRSEDAADNPPGAGGAESGGAKPGGEEAEEFAFEVWYLNGEALHRAARTHERTQSVGRVALEALLQGPSPEELDEGVVTAIPTGTNLLGLDIDNGLASVDLTQEYASGGGSLSMRMRLAQVVYTLTQFPTVSSVAFSLDGEPVTSFSSEGIVIDKPLRRDDFSDLLPPIAVDMPAAGAEVTSPVAISGSANVFEATVSIRILDSNGKEIAKTFTTATCGTGCRGEYTTDVEFKVDERQAGTIEVYEESMADGSNLFTVRVPVTLVP